MSSVVDMLLTKEERKMSKELAKVFIEKIKASSSYDLANFLSELEGMHLIADVLQRQ